MTTEAGRADGAVPAGTAADGPCGCLRRARAEHAEAQHVKIDYPRRLACRPLERVIGGRVERLRRWDDRCLALRRVADGWHYPDSCPLALGGSGAHDLSGI